MVTFRAPIGAKKGNTRILKVPSLRVINYHDHLIVPSCLSYISDTLLLNVHGALHFTVFSIFEISLNNFPRLFLWAPNPSRECLTGSFCQKHCCKPFNVTQLGFCCTFKKQNNPYIGLQVKLGLRSTCFAKRFKAGLRHGIKNDPSKDQLRGWRWGRNGQRALRSAWFEELTCFAVSKAGAAAARWFYSTSTCSSRQQWWCNSHQPDYFNPIIFPPQSQYLSATRRHNLVQLQ